MAAMNYDQLWTEFITNTKTDDINLPQTDEKRYDAIHSAIRHFNNRMDTDYVWDDDTESISDSTVVDTLVDDHLILLAHFLRLAFLRNQLTDFVSVWNPFAKEVGIKNLGDQVNRLEVLVDKEEHEIDKIILNSTDEYM